jgi:hypothetical protein
MHSDNLAVANSDQRTDTAVVAPVIPLPWALERGTKYPRIRGGDEGLVCVPPEGFRNERDARYIVHACNAYPTLVAALKAIHQSEEGCGETDRPQMVALRSLLRDLGEQP